MNENLDHAYSRLGLCFGGILQRNINQNSSLQAEIYYSMEGSSWGRKLLDLDYDGNSASYTLHYARMSFKFERVVFRKSNQSEFKINGGISFAYLLSASQNWIVEAPVQSELEFGPADISKELNKFDYGPFVGLVLPLSSQKLAFDVRYYHGVSKLYNNNYQIYFNDFKSKSEFKNRGFTIALIYKI
jgi:hypothetical protein